MRHLDNLRRALSLFGAARDLAIESRRFEWEVPTPNTFYLEAEYADIRLSTHEHRQILAKVELQAGFGWQLATDQDEAGVYIVARRKPVLGSIGRAKFTITLPSDVHLSLQLEHCQLCLVDLNTSLDLAPFE